MRRDRLIHALALVVGAALFLSACGGDDSPEVPIVVPTDTATASLSQEEFIEEADALCEQTNTDIGTFVANGEGLTAAGEIADLRQALIDDITDLGPPDEDRRTLDEYLTGLEGQVEAGEKIALAIERDSDTTEFETELTTARDAASTAATAYGFEECGAEVTASADSTDTGVAPVTPSDGTVAPVEPAVPDDGGGVAEPDTGSDGGTDDGGTGGGVSPGGGGISP
jgi:hypothetical protein